MSNTPITGAARPKGIKEQLCEAKTESEVKQLLAKGALFLNASPTTRRQWERIANRKIAEFRAKQ